MFKKIATRYMFLLVNMKYISMLFTFLRDQFCGLKISLFTHQKNNDLSLVDRVVKHVKRVQYWINLSNKKVKEKI